MSKITFGSDPEFMLVNAKGRFVSAIGILKGTDENRVKTDSGHELYYDNVLAECSIIPASTKKTVVKNFKNCFTDMVGLIGSNHVKIQSSGNYIASELKHKDAQKFACHPDLCAYYKQTNLPPPIPEDGFRSAGGHIHIGYPGGKNDHLDEGDVEKTKSMFLALEIIKTMDMFLGIPSLFIDDNPESIKRRNLYGKAGCHRQKEFYGVEYRSLSNFWLASPKLVELVFDVTKFATNYVIDGHYDDLDLDDDDVAMELYDTINAGDKVAAAKQIEKISSILPGKLFSKLEEAMNRSGSYDFYEEWELG